MTERKNDIIIELGTLPRKIKTHAVAIRHSSIFDFKKFLRNFVIICCLKKVSKTPKTLQDTVKPKLRWHVFSSVENHFIIFMYFPIVIVLKQGSYGSLRKNLRKIIPKFPWVYRHKSQRNSFKTILRYQFKPNSNRIFIVNTGMWLFSKFFRRELARNQRNWIILV